MFAQKPFVIKDKDILPIKIMFQKNSMICDDRLINRIIVDLMMMFLNSCSKMSICLTYIAVQSLQEILDNISLIIFEKNILMYFDKPNLFRL